ncbi:hypothetical protein HHK36_023824 [Tetracentron sinense]|uniref:Protein kinase domain-containing protein n=1 Tax=Tetracentron sinense TaxID=13715 RepID=A0A835D912_TETSI|nr:hypothetical protein HHK36_023824 [Tetracentron sinense]
MYISYFNMFHCADSSKKRNIAEEILKIGNGNITAQVFTFRELATATNNFKSESLIGEGGFGRVYKGRVDNTNQVVAVKKLDRNGLQGNREFLVEAQPLFKDKMKFMLMADPLLEGKYPIKGLYQALAVAAMCLQEEASTRPLISDVVTALEYLAVKKNEGSSKDALNSPSHDRNSSEGAEREIESVNEVYELQH